MRLVSSRQVSPVGALVYNLALRSTTDLPLVSTETTRRRLTVALAVVAALLPAACRRSPDKSAAPSTPPSPSEARDVRCVERPDACVLCAGPGGVPAPVDPGRPPARPWRPNASPHRDAFR